MMILSDLQAIETQPVSTNSPLELPPFSIDPTNPLAWMLVITLLLGNTDEVVNAIANLIRAIASLRSKIRKKNDRRD